MPDRSGAALLDESLPQPPSPPLPPSTTGISFRTPQESDDLTDPAGLGSASAWNNDELHDESATQEATSSRASSGRAPASPIADGAMEEAARKAVQIIGAQVHDATTVPGSLESVNGLWLVTDGEAERIADPLASIVARRGGIAGAAANPDLADALNAMVGLAGYVGRNVMTWLHIRKHRRLQLAAGMIVDPAPAETQESAS